MNGVYRGRSKLYHDSIKYPGYFDLYYSGKDVEEEMPFPNSPRIPTEKEIDLYKYCIVIDGHVSSWGRPIYTLVSDCVPLVIKSKF